MQDHLKAIGRLQWQGRYLTQQLVSVGPISIYSPKTQQYSQVGTAKDQDGHQVF